MSDPVARALGAVLLIVHLGLGLWALLGLSKMFLSSPPLSDPLFPGWLELAQWLTSLAGAGVFIIGYLARWRYTAIALVVAYGAMATVCAIETFGYLDHDTRFRAMAIEYAAYASILALVFHRRLLGSRFA